MSCYSIRFTDDIEHVALIMTNKFRSSFGVKKFFFAICITDLVTLRNYLKYFLYEKKESK